MLLPNGGKGEGCSTAAQSWALQSARHLSHTHANTRDPNERNRKPFLKSPWLCQTTKSKQFPHHETLGAKTRRVLGKLRPTGHPEQHGCCLHGEGGMLSHVETTRVQKRLLMITSMESVPTDVSVLKQSTPDTCPQPLGLWNTCSLSCQPLSAPCLPDFLLISCLLH